MLDDGRTRSTHSSRQVTLSNHSHRLRTDSQTSASRDWRLHPLTGNRLRRGEIWLAEMDKPRPVVVMHRNFAGRVLNSVLVAPLTTTLRDIPTAVRLGPADGIDRECIAALDNLTLLRKDRFLHRIGQLSPERMNELCRALAIAVSCSDGDGGAFTVPAPH